jgi:hypothetical protein
MEEPGAPPLGSEPARPPSGDAGPAPREAVPDDPSEPAPAATADRRAGDGPWVALLLGVALLLVTCVVLMLLAGRS